MKKLISLLLCAVLAFSALSVAVAETADDLKTSVSGLFTFALPENCMLMDGEVMAAIVSQLSEKDYQEQLGMDEASVQNMLAAIESVDYTAMDVVYTNDLKGNLNVQCVPEVGVTQLFLPLLKDSLDQQLAATYCDMFGIDESAIVPQELTTLGENQFYMLVMDVLGVQVHLYITFDGAGNQFAFTFTNMDVETETALMSSVVFAN